MLPRARSSLLSFLLLAAGPHRLFADDWPQWRGPSRDGIWREEGIVERFSGPELAPRWSAPVGPGFAGPTVSGTGVFVFDRVNAPAEQERILCFDADTGRRRWTHAYPCVYRDVDYALGPRAAITIAGGRAFALGTMGHAHALDAATGRVLWQRNLAVDFGAEVNFWGMTSAPLVAGEGVIFQVGGERGACLVALDARTGAELWRALDGRASYVPPRLVRLDDRDAVLAWTAQWLAWVDAANGDVLARVPYRPSRMVHQVADPVLDASGQHVLLTSFYDGSLWFGLEGRPATPRLVWHRHGPNERKTDALHAMTTTPLIRDGHAYGIDSHGELRCLELATGERVWEDTSLMGRNRWATAHLVQNGDRVWISTENGELVIARLSPRGFEALSRARFITPDTRIIGREEPLAWSHPAYAHRRLFARSDSRLICIDLAATR